MSNAACWVTKLGHGLQINTPTEKPSVFSPVLTFHHCTIFNSSDLHSLLNLLLTKPASQSVPVGTCVQDLLAT